MHTCLIENSGNIQVLIKTELELKKTLAQLQEKHKNIALVHEKIVENMRILGAGVNIENLMSTQPPIKSEVNEGEGEEQMSSTINVNVTNNLVATETMNDVDTETIKAKFFEFLNETMKKFDMLFLCHSKQEFLNLMREKGIEAVNEQNTNARGNKRAGTQRRNAPKQVKTESNVYGDEMELEDDNLETDDRDIFDTFTATQKAKVEGFVKSEKKK